MTEANLALSEVNALASPCDSKAARHLIHRLNAENYIGGGAERRVFDLGDNKVVAFFVSQDRLPTRTPQELKSYFYASKLAHLMLPDNIPDVHLAASQPPLIISDRVPAAREADYGDRYEFRRRLERFGWTEAIDYNSDNFTVDKDGDVVYLDVVTPEKLITPEFRDNLAVLDESQYQEARRLMGKIIHNTV